MHELSLVMSIVDIASEQTNHHDGNKVEQIELEVGSLAGIEMDLFLFAWDAAVQSTVLEKAERIIHEIPAVARCRVCANEHATETLYEPCPSCGAYLTEVIQGQELRVRSLIVS